jgi:hypothetical protein
METELRHGMKNGTCPNCDSSEIYAGANLTFKEGRYNVIPISLRTAAPLDNYVCVECGYVESYIGDRARLEQIKKKWSKVK